VSTDGDTLALRLSARIDELASSLAAAGPIGAEGMRLLESAALAAMHAVALEELSRVEPVPRPRAGRLAASAFPRAA
jgi:hypothetical protein